MHDGIGGVHVQRNSRTIGYTPARLGSPQPRLSLRDLMRPCPCSRASSTWRPRVIEGPKGPRSSATQLNLRHTHGLRFVPRSLPSVRQSNPCEVPTPPRFGLSLLPTVTIRYRHNGDLHDPTTRELNGQQCARCATPKHNARRYLKPLPPIRAVGRPTASGNANLLASRHRMVAEPVTQ